MSNDDDTRFASESTVVDSDAEQQPLLPGNGKVTPTPLPILQLAVVCFARLAEPIAYTQIFPYINQMVEELDVVSRPEDIGFYSGLIDSAFAVAQLMTIYQWGRLSDKIGRKPVVLIGLCGVAVASFCFGLSTNFWQMMLSRALAGALTGNVAIISTIVSDITDSTNEGQAFPLPGVTWSIGCVLGPLLGGLLSHPAERYPSTFGRFEFLHKHPFFLPSFVTSMLMVASILVVFIWLEESLPRITAEKRRRLMPIQENGNIASEYSAITPVTRPPTPPEGEDGSPKLADLLRHTKVFRVMLTGFFLTFIWIADRTLLVLWSYTPIALGGLDRTPREIGIALASAGCLNIFLSLVAFPMLHKRFGTMNLFVWPTAVWPFVFATIALVSFIAKSVLPSATTEHVGLGGLWGGVAVILLLECLATLCFPAFFLMIKLVAPNPESIGGMFGLALSANCLGEAAGPAIASSLFAWTIDTNFMGGNFVWLAMGIFTTIAFFVASSVRGL